MRIVIGYHVVSVLPAAPYWVGRIMSMRCSVRPETIADHHAQKKYPGMRTIVGEYMMHKIDIK